MKPEAGPTCFQQPAKTISPKGGELLGYIRLIETGIGRIGLQAGKARVRQPLTVRSRDSEHAGMGFCQGAVHVGTIENDIKDQSEAVRPADLRHASDRVVSRLCVQYRVCRFDVARQENIACGPRREQGRRGDMIESHPAAALEMNAPPARWTDHQRMQVVDFRRQLRFVLRKGLDISFNAIMRSAHHSFRLNE